MNSTGRLIAGLDGADAIEGTEHSDTIYGYDGNNSEQLDDNDTIWGFEGDDWLQGDAGNDLIYGGRAIHHPEDTADTISGGLADDTIYGNGGNDQISGQQGNDLIHGGEGNDLIIGGLDSADASDGNDTLLGSTGSDEIYGSDGADILLGGSDIYDPGDGADTIEGGDGDDLIYGNGGDDLLIGGAGNDTLYGGYGVNTLTGGQGNDVFFINDASFVTDVENGESIGDDPTSVTQSRTFSNGENQTIIITDFDAGDVVNINTEGMISVDDIAVDESDGATRTIDLPNFNSRIQILNQDGAPPVLFNIEEQSLGETTISIRGVSSSGGDDDNASDTGSGGSGGASTNNAPTINAQSFSASEFVANGTVIATVVANDPDILQNLNYTIIGGSGASVFSINAATGEIRVVDNSPIDFEGGTTSYTLDVQVTDDDAAPLSDSATITINITDENDAPENTVAGTPFATTQPSAVDITGVSVADDSATITVTLAAANGTITVLDNVVGGVVAGDIAGNGTASVTISNVTIAQLNATFSAGGSAISYQGNDGFSGADTITLTASDGTLSDVDTMSVNVTAAPNALTVSVTDNLVGDGTANAYTGTAANWHTNDTVDGGAGNDTLTITSGSVNVTIDGGNYTGFEEVETLVLPDAAHSITVDDDYFGRGTGPNSDTLAINAAASTQTLTVDAGGITDNTHLLSIQSGSGDDNVTGTVGDNNIDVGDGDDQVTVQAWTGTGGSGSAPNAVSAGNLIAWYDATDLDGDGVTEGVAEAGISGGVVDIWVNKGTAAVTLGDASSAGGARPAYNAAGSINGQASLTFDGNISQLDSANSFTIDTTNEHTVFIVSQQTGNGGANWGRLLGHGSGANQILRSSTGGNGNVTALNDGIQVHGFTAHPYDAIYELVIDQGALDGFDNGTQTILSQGYTHNITGELVIGNVAGHDRGFAGEIAEVIIYDAALSATDREDVAAYLQNKYAINIGAATADHTLQGGAGDDTLTLTTNVADTAFDGTNNVSGFETIDLSGNDNAHNLTITDGYFTAGTGVTGGVLVMDVSGNTTGVTIDGGSLTGTNRLDVTGSDGNDNLSGGAGNDTMDGMDGTDTMDGGAGDDSFNSTAAHLDTTDVIDGGTGNDTLTVSSGSLNVTIDAGNYAGLQGVETIVLPDAAHSITLDDDYFERGAGLNNDTFNINATASTQTLTIDASGIVDAEHLLNILSGTGDDNIVAGAGSDTISTGDGNDTINAGAGDDNIDAGSGNDRVSIDLSGATSQAPNLVSSGSLQLWFDASDLDGDGIQEGLAESGLSGTDVTAWGDKSGNAGRDITDNGSAALRPTYTTTGIGGQASITFDGSNGLISGADTSDIFGVSPSEGTIFFVSEKLGVTGGEQFLAQFPRSGTSSSFYIANLDGRWSGSLDADTDYAGILLRESGDFVSPQADDVATVGTDFILTTTFNASNVSAAFNDTDLGAIAYGGATYDAGDGNDPFSIGSRSDMTSDFFHGNISEIIVYDTELSTTDYNRVMSYLDNKYSIVQSNAAMNDTLIGGAGNDTLIASAGVVDITLNGANNITGFEVIDLTANDNAHNLIITDGYFDAGTSITGNVLTIDATGATQDINIDGSAIADITHAINVTTGSGNDTIRGGGSTSTALGDTINAGDGDNEVYSSGGPDSITTGNGDDYIEAGTGIDTISSGLGNDTVLGDGGTDNVSLGGGDDVFNDDTQTGVFAGDTVYGEAGNDTINGSGGNDVFDGGTGEDIIEGGAESDTIDGGGNDDLVNGGDAGDSLDAGDGNDIIYGDDGFFQENSGFIVIEAENYSSKTDSANHSWEITDYAPASGGKVTLIADGAANGGNGGERMSYNVDFTSTGTFYLWVRGTTNLRTAGNEGNADSVFIEVDGVNITTAPNGSPGGPLTGYNDGLNWNNSTTRADFTITTTGEHTITLLAREDGFAADKILITDNNAYTPSGTGPAENTRIVTSGGADTIYGGDGDDVIYGDLGDDCITGGLGQDTMTGGNGSADDFIFEAIADSTAVARDVISDFEAGSDEIDLSALSLAFTVASTDGTAGNGTADFTPGAGGPEIAWGQSGGNTIVYVDTDGDDAADMEIELTGSLSISGGDFVF